MCGAVCNINVIIILLFGIKCYRAVIIFSNGVKKMFFLHVFFLLVLMNTVGAPFF